MNETELIRKRCGAKKRFISQDLAYNAQQSLQPIARNKISAYLCPYCHYWHIGRIRYTDVTPVETHRMKLNRKLKHEKMAHARIARKTCLTIPERTDPERKGLV